MPSSTKNQFNQTLHHYGHVNGNIATVKNGAEHSIKNITDSGTFINTDGETITPEPSSIYEWTVSEQGTHNEALHLYVTFYNQSALVTTSVVDAMSELSRVKMFQESEEGMEQDLSAGRHETQLVKEAVRDFYQRCEHNY